MIILCTLCILYISISPFYIIQHFMEVENDQTCAKGVPPRWGCFLLGPWLWEEVSEGHWKKKSLQIIAAIYEVLVLRKVVVKYIFLGSVKELQVQNTFEGWHSKEHLPANWVFLKPNWNLLRYFGACKVITYSTGSICERQSQPTSQNKTKILNTCLAWLVHLHSIGTQGISRCLESFLFIPPPALPAKMIQFDVRIKGWSHQLLDTHHNKPL